MTVLQLYSRQWKLRIYPNTKAKIKDFEIFQGALFGIFQKLDRAFPSLHVPNIA